MGILKIMVDDTTHAQVEPVSNHDLGMCTTMETY